jgi:hypothetical protein
VKNFWLKRRGLVSNHLVVALFFFTSATIVSVFVNAPMDPGGTRRLPLSEYSAAQIALIVTPLVFLLASGLVFFRPRICYSLGLFAGLVALSCFIWIELSNFPWANSWIALNIPDKLDAWDKQFVTLAKLTILAVAMIVVVVTVSVLRLLPANWVVRRFPVHERTWPAFVVSLLVLAVWFGGCVMPYRLPGIVDFGVGPDLKILHVEKRGLQFHETEVAVLRDGRFGVGRTDRRLFEYRFTGQGASGVMPRTMVLSAMALLQSPQLNGMHTLPAKALRTWNAEGWYLLGTKSLLAFTSECHSQPPREVVDLFREIEKLPVTGAYREQATKDVCLGFCYDPIAALGFVYANNRCFTNKYGKTRCQ